MAVATVNLPAIVLSGGPMLNSYLGGKHAGAGTIIWEARRQFAAGKITEREFAAMIADSAPSAGHCNTMGTALLMNSLAEALGMSLPGCASIPAPYRERLQMAYETGKRAVDLVREELVPSKILTARCISQRDRGEYGHRWFNQLPTARDGDRAPCRRRSPDQGMGNGRVRCSPAGEFETCGRTAG